MNDARSIEQLAQDNARGEDNNESASGEDEEGEEGEQHSSDGDYSSESDQISAARQTLSGGDLGGVFRELKNEEHGANADTKRGFLSQKGSGRGRGVKEKDLNKNKKNTSSGISVTMDSDDTMNDDTPIGVASAVQEGVTPYVVDLTVEMEKKNSLEDTTSSYANGTGKPSRKKLNFRTLFTPGGNGIGVVVPVESIRAISDRFANIAYGFFLGKRVAYPVVANYVRNTWGKYGLVRSMFSSSTGLFSFQFSSMDGLDAMLENGPWFIRNNPLILKKWHPDVNLLKEDVSTIPVWVKLHGVPVTAFSEDGLSGRSSYARAMIELRADVELKDNILVVMPKIAGEGHHTCNIRVEYEWKPPRCTSCKVSGHIHEECPKNTCAGETKTMKKPSQTSIAVIRRKVLKPTIDVSNSNPFEVLNSVDNDVELGTNEGTTNFVNNEANSSGSSIMNIDISSTGTTPIIDKIGKFEDLLSSGQVILVDNAGNPLKKVELSGDYDSEDEVASVDNDMARSLASIKGRFWHSKFT
ncbi:zinc finger, CCHC-type containing protein [Tanacetum coccineum]